MTTFTSRRMTMFPFTLLGIAAIVVGGVLAARSASQPIPVLVWLVAYLVLVVGVAQFALGWGQARLAARPSPYLVALQWLIFNLGNAGTIAGTLAGEYRMTLAGSILVAVAMLLFAWGAAGNLRHPLWQIPYYVLAAIIFASAVVGALLAAGGPAP